LSRHLQELKVLAGRGDATRVRAKMQEIVPEYRLQTDGSQSEQSSRERIGC